MAGLTHTAGAFIRLRAQVSGTNPTTIRIRAWADGTTEPTTWQYTATNSVAALQAAGGVGLQAYLSSATTNAPVLVTFDDFLVTSIFWDFGPRLGVRAAGTELARAVVALTSPPRSTRIPRCPGSRRLLATDALMCAGSDWRPSVRTGWCSTSSS